VRACASSAEELEAKVLSLNAGSPVVVYSKSWCPFCGQVKGLFQELGVEVKAIELDGIVEENELQDVLYKLTNQRTVPNVFIGGSHVGGCDDTVQLYASKKLVPMLEEAGAL